MMSRRIERSAPSWRKERIERELASAARPRASSTRPRQPRPSAGPSAAAIIADRCPARGGAISLELGPVPLRAGPTPPPGDTSDDRRHP